MVSPIAATNKDLTEGLGKALNRPAFLKVPAPLVKLMFGRMAEEMLLSSTRVTPKVLLESGYGFQDQALDAVLRYCLSERSAQ
jgi:NAD dependent epimerase/dehydratase family enzyme